MGRTFDPVHVPVELDAMESGKLSGDYVRVAQTLYVEEIVKGFGKLTLFVHGTADEAVPFAVSQKFVTLYKDAYLVEIPGDTHCYDKHLEMVCQAVEAFMQKLQ